MLSRINRIFSNLIPTVSAHCDTEEGPAVSDGRLALETGQLNHALKWIPATEESELKSLFEKVQQVRKLNPDAKYVADRLFLETLIRIHRLAEGVGFTGIKSIGSYVPEVVLEADRALTTGDLTPVLALVPPDRQAELEHKYKIAMSKKDFDLSDLAAGRDYISAYVSYFKFAEGEDDSHHVEKPSQDHHT